MTATKNASGIETPCQGDSGEPPQNVSGGLGLISHSSDEEQEGTNHLSNPLGQEEGKAAGRVRGLIVGSGWDPNPAGRGLRARAVRGAGCAHGADALREKDGERLEAKHIRQERQLLLSIRDR